MEGLESALREGCAGQLPEIYDGAFPTVSRGCFAQAWSVGELLRVYEKLEKYGIITTAWLLYLRIERFLRNRRNPPRICQRPMAAVRPWYDNTVVFMKYQM